MEELSLESSSELRVEEFDWIFGGLVINKVRIVLILSVVVCVLLHALLNAHVKDISLKSLLLTFPHSLLRLGVRHVWQRAHVKNVGSKEDEKRHGELVGRSAAEHE